MLRTVPGGFISPCPPTKIDKLPWGGQPNEIKHDGCRAMARKQRRTERVYAPDSRYGGVLEEDLPPPPRPLPPPWDPAPRPPPHAPPAARPRGAGRRRGRNSGNRH